MKKYEKIIRADKDVAKSMIKDMPEMTVLEKIDGANASFKLENGELKCFSRNNELDENNTLLGFYGWVHENIKKSELVEGDVFFGEWLVQHKVKYSESAYKNFYLFDIYGSIEEKYLSHDLVESASYVIGRTNSIDLAPVLYKGEPLTLKELDTYVGKSELGAEEGEGIVVKSHHQNERYKLQPRVKLVSTKFKEVKQVKPQKNSDQLTDWVESVLTPARVEKMIYKLRDEELIPQDLSLSDTGVVLKATGSKMVDDIFEEELDSLLKVIQKKVSKMYPIKVKEFIEIENKNEEENV